MRAIPNTASDRPLKEKKLKNLGVWDFLYWGYPTKASLVLTKTGSKIRQPNDGGYESSALRNGRLLIIDQD